MPSIPESIELVSPAKVNLMLSVHGPQDDGFHALTSVVVALDFGDRLSVNRVTGGSDVLSCTDPAVPVGMDNLVLKAATLFREEVEQQVYFEFHLEKHVPMGAGLGGGSSNASIALRAMNALLGEPLSKSQLMELAAQLGSDCPFFIDSRPALMRGRGEIIEPLEETLAAALRGQQLVLFRPGFGVNTAWAYGQLRQQAPGSYESEVLAMKRFAAFEQSLEITDLLYNSFQPIVAQKYLSIACLLDLLDDKGVESLMSGSGSCCFAILKESDLSSSQMHEFCRNAWGESVFWVVTSII